MCRWLGLPSDRSWSAWALPAMVYKVSRRKGKITTVHSSPLFVCFGEQNEMCKMQNGRRFRRFFLRRVPRCPSCRGAACAIPSQPSLVPALRSAAAAPHPKPQVWSLGCNGMSGPMPMVVVACFDGARLFSLARSPRYPQPLRRHLQRPSPKYGVHCFSLCSQWPQ